MGELANKGLCGEARLEAVPFGPRISDVHVRTYVGRKRIEFNTGFLGLPKGDFQLSAIVRGPDNFVKTFPPRKSRRTGRRNLVIARSTTGLPRNFGTLTAPKTSTPPRFPCLTRLGKSWTSSIPRSSVSVSLPLMGATSCSMVPLSTFVASRTRLVPIPPILTRRRSRNS